MFMRIADWNGRILKTIVSKVDAIFSKVVRIEVTLEKLISSLLLEDKKKTRDKGVNDNHTTNR